MDGTNPGRRPAGAGSVFCGVDVGASATKLVLIDGKGVVRAKAVRSSGVDYAATARACLDEALAGSGLREEDVVRTVSTGYGRRNVAFAESSLTEIHCHGIGCYHHLPGAMTIVDIGGQDSKVIRLDEAGRRVDFRMNRKCAAGTGAFIEEMAMRLDLAREDMDRLAKSTRDAVNLSSFCTVFAKTEILTHLRRGVDVAALVRGAFLSVINRVVEMDILEGRVVMSGGVVAYNPTIVEILAERLGRPVDVPPFPQFTGALGAALTASARPKEDDDA